MGHSKRPKRTTISMMRAEPAKLVRRRHVFYVEGYDPQGARGYSGLFRRECKRFLTVWPVTAEIGELVLDSDDLAHWDIETKGPNWQVSTRYEFLRLEDFIATNLARPLISQALRALRWMLNDLVSGTLLRIFRASWRFALHLIVPQALLLAWLALSLAAGALLGYVTLRWLSFPALAALFCLAAGAILTFVLLRPLAERWFVIRVTNGWPYLREFARDAPSGYDRSIDVCARRVVLAAQAAEVDEILIVGHSAGGVIAPAVAARALELDPNLGRRGPAVTLMTVGSLLPAFALHPAAAKLRNVIRRLAVEGSLLWVDCQARKDVMNFWDFDPVRGVGVEVGADRCNPLVWTVRLHDMLTDERYERLRYNYFRMHYQYIMGNDRRAPYDYFMLTCGPVRLAEWARSGGRSVLKAFSDTAAYRACAPVA